MHAPRSSTSERPTWRVFFEIILSYSINICLLLQMVRRVEFDLDVTHPFFVIHLPASTDSYSLRAGAVLVSRSFRPLFRYISALFLQVKPRQNSSTLSIYHDSSDGSTIFLATDIEPGPSCITALDARTLIMAFPDGSIQVRTCCKSH